MSTSKHSTTSTHSLHIPIFESLDELHNFVTKVIATNYGARQAEYIDALWSEGKSYAEIAKLAPLSGSRGSQHHIHTKYGKGVK